VKCPPHGLLVARGRSNLWTWIVPASDRQIHISLALGKRRVESVRREDIERLVRGRAPRERRPIPCKLERDGFESAGQTVGYRR